MGAENASMGLALADAARNCAKENAKATITLKSGVQFTGKLKLGPADLDQTVHLQIDRFGSGHVIERGWATIDRAEIAAVESHR